MTVVGHENSGIKRNWNFFDCLDRRGIVFFSKIAKCFIGFKINVLEIEMIPKNLMLSECLYFLIYWQSTGLSKEAWFPVTYWLYRPMSGFKKIDSITSFLWWIASIIISFWTDFPPLKVKACNNEIKIARMVTFSNQFTLILVSRFWPRSCQFLYS